MKEIINLGWANGWDKMPDMIKECHTNRNGEKHDIVIKCNYRGYEKVTCHTCGYTYEVDTTYLLIGA